MVNSEEGRRRTFSIYDFPFVIFNFSSTPKNLLNARSELEIKVRWLWPCLYVPLTCLASALIKTAKTSADDK